MITISDVPTRTPMPMVEIRRSCECERVKVRGSEPARKELRGGRVRLVEGWDVWCFWGTHAMAITVLKVSSMKRPSNILSVCLELYGASKTVEGDS